MHTIIQFREQKLAEDFAAMLRNRFGLAVLTYEDAKAHVMGDDADDIDRQVERLWREFGGCVVLSVSRRRP
jgi:hypothetical protein